MTSKSGSFTQACVIPFVIYVVGGSFLGRLTTQQYPIGYAVVAGLSGLSLWWLMPAQTRRQVMPIHWRIGWGILVGVVGIVLWIVLCHLHLERQLTADLPTWLQVGERVSFNPLDELTSPFAKATFLAVRLLGIAVIVPLIEEFFWRCFLLRWTIDPDWQEIPLGTFTWSSCLIVAALFTLAHPEWFAAASYCLLINALLYWKRDLWQCVIAHATSNFILAIYVLWTGHWFLW